MTSDDVQIKQFELTDEAALLSYLGRVYADEPRKSEPDFWRWHFLDNPYTRADDVPLWIVKRGAEVVGQAATILVELQVGGERTRGIWILDFILQAEYRGRGLGKRLLLLAREKYPTMMALGFNEQSGAVLRSLKWEAMGSINRYHKLLFPGDALGELSRLGPIRQLANLSYAPFRPRRARLAGQRHAELRPLAEFDASFDIFWQEAASQWPCAVVRSSAYLNWQFIRQPGKKFDVLGLYKQNRLLGYVVLFFRRETARGVPPKAAISDLCYGPVNSQAVIDELLKGALRLALERRAGSLVTDVLDQRVEERLRHFGFWRVKSAPRFMVGTLEHQELLYRPANWFLTRADSDVSIFEQPNL